MRFFFCEVDIQQAVMLASQMYNYVPQRQNYMDRMIEG